MSAFTKAISALALASAATAQYALPTKDVPYIGGNVFKCNDPAVASYPFPTLFPVSRSSTVATTTGAKEGYLIPSDATGKYPSFQVSEGHPKAINSSKLFKACAGQCEGKFKKILHIVFENEVYQWTMGQAHWKLVVTRGKLLARSYAITHPSLPNYDALVAGDFFGMADEDFYNVNFTSIYDLLEAKNVSYGTYAEWYNPIATHRGPNDCNNYVTNGPIDNTNPDWWSQVYRRLDVLALLFSTYTSKYEC